MKSVVVVVILTASCVLVAAPHSLLPGHTKDTSVVAATSILRTHSQCRHAALLLTDGDKVRHHSSFFIKRLQVKVGIFSPRYFLQRVEAVQAPRGVAVFRAAANGLSDNNTHTHLQETVDQIRQVNVNTEFLH
ncbi:uncharacterized protein LOC123512029 isoform X2 [Portunus trituberculatus]|uniref:uncharacterized protein LOC123512029 isoform X2 n=1 Tax=Portunus trituberculatus TaxID=210409 RepID=UPI001E1CD2D0|nr:uncharacterized protein LOC123512029 isoform X2 [Portunus trituberculatus]